MKILYVGDVMGEVGLQIVEDVVPRLRKEKQLDLVIAQSENATNGKGINRADFERIQRAGVDFCTGGNWSLFHDDIHDAMGDQSQPIIRPANLPIGNHGIGYKYIRKHGKTTFVISLLGKIVGKDADLPVDNPLKKIDSILDANQDNPRDATIVNFHGDYSSEKVIIGHYLDGRVTAVIGDHWHVPTADARVLPKGTGHITDVGMVGALNSSLGVSLESVLTRWRDGKQTRNVLETAGPRQFNGLLITTNEQQLAESVELIQIIN